MIGLLVALVVIPGTVGDLLNSYGMKHHGEVNDWSPRGLLRLAGQLVRNPYIMGGIPAMAVSFFALMSLISATNLSFAIPITASSYVLETGLAKYVLHEHVDWRRWVGAWLVAVGVALLSI
ncbi:MAG: EamA family transporter [Terriglobales bacterium]